MSSNTSAAIRMLILPAPVSSTLVPVSPDRPAREDPAVARHGVDNLDAPAAGRVLPVERIRQEYLVGHALIREIPVLDILDHAARTRGRNHLDAQIADGRMSETDADLHRLDD